MADPSGVPRRVLIFGSSNVGKTSLCNALTGGNRPTSDGAAGCTFKSHSTLVTYRGVRYELIDTVGLNETDGGTVQSAEAMQNLLALLKSTKDNGGFNLVIMVFPKGTVLNHTRDNYEFFIKKLCHDAALPKVAVITQLEDWGNNPERWLDAITERGELTNEKIITENHQMLFNKFVCCSFATTKKDGKIMDSDMERIYEKRRAASARAVWDAISTYSTDKAVDVIGQRDIKDVFKDLWNSLVNTLVSWGIEAAKVWLYDNELVTLLVRLGWTMHEAKKLIEEHGL